MWAKERFFMLHIDVVCVGKIRENYLKDAVLEYSKRLCKYCVLNIIELPDEKLPNKLNNSLIREIKQKESNAILSHIKKDSYVIALDLNGKNYSSIEFSSKIQEISLTNSHITFLIGGSLGMSNELLSSSKEFSEKLSNIALNQNSTITFLIGGTLGMSSELLSHANELICFSKMTFPHQLIRVFLLEQLFRSFKIQNHETYHR